MDKSKRVLPLTFEGKPLTEGMFLSFHERIDQLQKVADIELDARKNVSFQLPIAAQILSTFKISMDAEFSPPFGWDEEWWVRLCRKPYMERLAISAALLMAEIDRVDFMNKKGIDFDTLTKKTKKDEA